MESLSDHRYILVTLQSDASRTSRGHRESQRRGDGERRQRDTHHPRWSVKNLDQDRLRAAMQATAWAAQLQETATPDAESRAKWLQEQLISICDAAMPRVKNKRRNAAYWWSPELEEKRRKCVLARRKLQHRKRRKVRSRDEEEHLRLQYRAAVVALQHAIKDGKDKAWRELMETIDRDPWGRPYRLVVGKLRGGTPPLTETMEPQLLKRVIDTLFPRDSARPPAEMPNQTEELLEPVTSAEMAVAVKKMIAKNTAPGPDGIHGKVISLTLPVLGEELRELFNKCLREGTVPGCWKVSRLVLLPKPGKDRDSPAAYRPICLLNEAGKLFERIVLNRVMEHLKNAGPDLHEHQYGFRPGRSTIDAIKRVKEIAEGSVKQGGVALAVSVDIVNAFNTMPWRAIREGLRKHGLPAYIRETIASYLDGRTIEYKQRDGLVCGPVERGVPQGSVLGPLLWNLGYDEILRATLPIGVHITCYADDTLLVASGREWNSAIRLMEVGLAALVKKLNNLGLEIAAQKTEAVWFHGLPRNRRPPASWIAIKNERIPVGRTIKYLGLTLDERLNFQEHFTRIAPRIERAAISLGRIMPNIGGPKEKVRRLYTAVIQSMTLYGAPIWGEEKGLTRKNVKLLRRVQRRIAIRLVRAYRTVSGEAAIALAGMTPYDHLAGAYAEIYWGSRAEEGQVREREQDQECVRTRAHRRAWDRWKQELEQTGAMRKRVIAAVLPSWERWAEAGPALLTFRVTQVLTGHGCFGEYLKRIGAELTADCHHCSAGPDSAQHTLEECVAFEEQRCALVTAIGPDLTPPAIVKALLAGGEKCAAATSFCEEVMSCKEAAERERERTASGRRRSKRRRPPAEQRGATTG